MKWLVHSQSVCDAVLKGCWTIFQSLAYYAEPLVRNEGDISTISILLTTYIQLNLIISDQSIYRYQSKSITKYM